MADNNPALIAVPALVVVALGAAWFLMAPESTDGPAPSRPAVEAAVPVASAPKAPPVEREAVATPNAQRPTAAVRDMNPQQLKEMLRSRGSIVNREAVQTGAFRPRPEMMRARVESHVKSAGDIARHTVGKLVDRGMLEGPDADLALEVVSEMEKDLDGVRQRMEAGQIDAGDALEEIENLQGQAFKELSDGLDGEVEPELEKAFAPPRRPRTPTPPPDGANVVPDGFWEEGVPLDWGEKK